MRFICMSAMLFSLALAGCGMNEQEARQTAQEKKLPPTEVQLMNQTKAGSDKDAKLLVEAGVNPNTRQANGMTVLMSAAFNGQVETAKSLLAHGAEVNATAKGYNALGFAVEKGDVAMIKLLMSHGADPKQVPEEGKSAEARARGRGDAAALLSAMQLQ